MKERPIASTQNSYVFQAYHLTETLKLKEIDRGLSEQVISKSATKLIYQEQEAGFFFIYRFGSIVFFNIEPARQTAIIEKIKTISGSKPGLITSEEYTMEIAVGAKNEASFEKVTLNQLTLERIELVALILAQSTALEYFEITVEDILTKSGDIIRVLSQRGWLKGSERSINKFIGFCMNTKQDLVSSMYLLDSPDETWDNQVLDTLYRGNAEMFELRERYKTIDYKLKMIQDNLGLIADLLKNRRATMLEVTIILLIAIEVVLFVYELLR